MLLANTMPSAKLSLHLMPVVFVMTTARRTRSQCVHPTRQHSRTSVSVCWTFANAKATTRFIILAAVQVKFLGSVSLRLSCLLQNMRQSRRPESGLSIAFVSASSAHVPLLPPHTHSPSPWSPLFLALDIAFAYFVNLLI